MPPGRCVLVGDSDFDMVAATASGVHPLGYAKTPGRDVALMAAGAEAVTDNMGDLIGALVQA